MVLICVFCVQSCALSMFDLRVYCSHLFSAGLWAIVVYLFMFCTFGGFLECCQHWMLCIVCSRRCASCVDACWPLLDLEIAIYVLFGLGGCVTGIVWLSVVVRLRGCVSARVCFLSAPVMFPAACRLNGTLT